MPLRLHHIIFSFIFSVAAVAVFIFFGIYLLLGLIALNIVCWSLVPIARKRGWGAEGRLTRHLNRPPIVEKR